MLGKLRPEKGQAMAEMAFMLPIAMVLFLGVLIFGLILNSKLVVVDAARDAARHVALGLGDARTKVEETIEDGWSLDKDNIDSVTTTINDPYVLVTVRYKQPVFFGNLLKLIGGSEEIGNNGEIILEHTASFKKETP